MWKSKAPTKLSFFIWTATLGKILTVNNLQRQQVVVEDWWENYWSILQHCPVAQELWNMLCSLFRVHRVMPCVVVELLASWSSKSNWHRTKVIWSMVPHCLMWGIWREHNACTFDGNERLIHNLKLTAWSFLSFRLYLSGQMLRVF